MSRSSDPLNRVKAVTDDEEWDDEEPAIRYPDVPTVDWTPPEIVATFYDTDGEPLIEIEAPRNPCGFS